MHRGYGYDFVDSPSGLIVPVTADVVRDGLDAKEVAFDLVLPGGTTTFLRADGTFATPATDAHVIEDEGTPLTQRAALNFTGTGVTVTDDAGNDATVVAIGTGGGGAILYDYEVTGSDKASIDTNVDGTTVANFSGYTILEAFFIGRTDEAVALSSILLNVNNDTSSIYDVEEISGRNVTSSVSRVAAAAQWTFLCPGTTFPANYPLSLRAQWPMYAGTTFYKAGTAWTSLFNSTAADSFILLDSLAYRSTSAITRIKVAAPSTKKLKIGSRLVVAGR